MSKCTGGSAIRRRSWVAIACKRLLAELPRRRSTYDYLRVLSEDIVSAAKGSILPQPQPGPHHVLPRDLSYHRVLV